MSSRSSYFNGLDNHYSDLAVYAYIMSNGAEHDASQGVLSDES